jgi:hypothetical protein
MGLTSLLHQWVPAAAADVIMKQRRDTMLVGHFRSCRISTPYNHIRCTQADPVSSIHPHHRLTPPPTQPPPNPSPPQIKELVAICKEYVIALRCELKRKELKEDDMARAAELAAYFTHCNLQVGVWLWWRLGWEFVGCGLQIEGAGRDCIDAQIHRWMRHAGLVMASAHMGVSCSTQCAIRIVLAANQTSRAAADLCG